MLTRTDGHSAQTCKNVPATTAEQEKANAARTKAAWDDSYDLNAHVRSW